MLVTPAGQKEPTPNTFAGWTQDLSFGGLRMLVRRAPPLNALVDMHIACTRPLEHCRIRGQVGWFCREGASFVVGVFVREPSKERLLEWRRILKRRGMTE